MDIMFIVKKISKIYLCKSSKKQQKINLWRAYCDDWKIKPIQTKTSQHISI